MINKKVKMLIFSIFFVRNGNSYIITFEFLKGFA